MGGRCSAGARGASGATVSEGLVEGKPCFGGDAFAGEGFGASSFVFVVVVPAVVRPADDPEGVAGGGIATALGVGGGAAMAEALVAGAGACSGATAPPGTTKSQYSTAAGALTARHAASA